MIIACFIISCLALLAAVTAIVLVFVNKKDSDRKHKVLMDLIGTSCQIAADGAVEAADDHIHEAMKRPVVQLLQAIDFSSKQKLETGAPTQKDISFAEAFAEAIAIHEEEFEEYMSDYYDEPDR